MKIVIDAGHGGHDPGAVGNGLREKDLTLSLALGIGKYLEQYDVEVVYTRTTDVFLPLSERAAIANRLGAGFFLSCHVNAGGGSGFESYIQAGTYAGKEKTDAIRRAIHSRVAAVFTAAGLPDRGPKEANLAVLRETNMPAVLLEYGFIDRAQDAAKLKDPAFLDRLALATAEGIAEALGLQKKTQPEPKQEHWAKADHDELRAAGLLLNDHPDLDAPATKGVVFALVNRLRKSL